MRHQGNKLSTSIPIHDRTARYVHLSQRPQWKQKQTFWTPPKKKTAFPAPNKTQSPLPTPSSRMKTTAPVMKDHADGDSTWSSSSKVCKSPYSTSDSDNNKTSSSGSSTSTVYKNPIATHQGGTAPRPGEADTLLPRRRPHASQGTAPTRVGHGRFRWNSLDGAGDEVVAELREAYHLIGVRCLEAVGFARRLLVMQARGL